MNDKKLLKELDDSAQEWIKNNNTIDEELIKQIFKMEGGDIFTNSKGKVAIGFLPFPGTLAIYFFEVTKDGRLKYADQRGINIDEVSKSRLLFAIKLCELRRDDIDDEDAGNMHQ